MINNNQNKILSISGFSFITKIHDGNFAAVNMNNNLQIFSGLKPFKCLNKKQLTKGTEIYNLKEIFISNKDEIKDSNINKIYLILYEKNILIYSFENGYKKIILIQKLNNSSYIGPLIQLSNKNILFFGKENKIKIMNYIGDKKSIYKNDIFISKRENDTFVLSFLELEKNQIITTSTNKHPKGENVIRIYNIDYNSNNYKLINHQNFNGYSCAIFENNMCKLNYQKTICIAINFYIKKNALINRNAIVLLNYEYLEITTIIEIEFNISTIFNFFSFKKEFNYTNEYEYIILSQYKESDTKIKNKSSDKNRFLDFYIFEPRNEYEPLLMEKHRIITHNQIDITNSFLLNSKYLVIFQTSQISIYEIY